MHFLYMHDKAIPFYMFLGIVLSDYQHYKEKGFFSLGVLVEHSDEIKKLKLYHIMFAIYFIA